MAIKINGITASLKITGGGSSGGTDTSDATATASDILSGKTAYGASGKITGTIASLGAKTYTPSATDQTIASGQYLSGVQTIKGDSNLIADNIKSGVTIFGITGTYTGSGSNTPNVPSDVDTVLDNNSWATIKAVSDAGVGGNYWSVGDTKSITINGAVGASTFSNLNIDAFIIGFDHNSALEGANRIHFLIGKINDIDVALCDSEELGYYTDGSKYFNLNHWGDYNYGGWSGCDMRYDILGSTNVAPSGYGSVVASGRTGYGPSNYDIVDNPVSNTLMAALPSDLRTVMKTVTKYSDNNGGHNSNSQGVASDVTQSVDYLFLLAEYEVQGTRTHANIYEQDSQAQYDYYKEGNSKIAYNHSDTTDSVWWWTRSVGYMYDNQFCYTLTIKDGAAHLNNAMYTAGLRPAFCV